MRLAYLMRIVRIIENDKRKGLCRTKSGGTQNYSDSIIRIARFIDILLPRLLLSAIRLVFSKSSRNNPPQKLRNSKPCGRHCRIRKTGVAG
jgi:hypothetical protein